MLASRLFALRPADLESLVAVQKEVDPRVLDDEDARTAGNFAVDAGHLMVDRWRGERVKLGLLLECRNDRTRRHWCCSIASQFEATFFNFEFPENYFHMRAPLFTPPEGVLDEAEIHARIAEALGTLPADIIDALNGALAEGGRNVFRELVFAKLSEQPEMAKVAPAILYRTLGKTLPEGMQNAAALWAPCHQHAMANRKSVEAAGFSGEGMLLGEHLFDAIIAGPSAVVISNEEWSDIWQRVPGGSINFDLPDMLEAAGKLNSEEPHETTVAFPFLLSAGERRDFTANTIFRNPAWRRKDADGAMYINPDDAARLNLGDGSNARITSERGSVDAIVEISDRMQRGHVSIPNGLGLDYPDERGRLKATGSSPNELTSSHHADEFVGTPWHKSVPVRVEAIG